MSHCFDLAGGSGGCMRLGRKLSLLFPSQTESSPEWLVFSVPFTELERAQPCVTPKPSGGDLDPRTFAIG